MILLQAEELARKVNANRWLFRGLNISLAAGEQLALQGASGVGKSTLLKVIMNQIAFEGTVEYGHNVSIGYFAQDQAEKLDPNLTIFETVDQVAKGEIRQQIRSLLGTFLFSGEDTQKKVGVLSGGERTRLALCQMLLSPSNFLILDEPTNHLDIPSKEILKKLNDDGRLLALDKDLEAVKEGETIKDKRFEIVHASFKDLKDILKKTHKLIFNISTYSIIILEAYLNSLPVTVKI